MAPLLSFPDALPPPRPAFDQGPGATSSPTVASTVAPLSLVSGSTSSLSPLAPPFLSQGRSKLERWRDDSLLPVSLNSPLPTKILVHSFRDALLAQRPPALSVLSAAVGTVVAAPRGPACSSQIGNRGLTQRCTNAARGAEVVEGGVQKIPTLTAQGNVTRHLALVSASIVSRHRITLRNASRERGVSSVMCWGIAPLSVGSCSAAALAASSPAY
jgi:hypothetical protein